MDEIKINKKPSNPYLESLKGVRSPERRIPQRVYRQPRVSGGKKSLPLILFIFSFLFVVASAALVYFGAKTTVKIVGKTVFLNIDSEKEFVAKKDPENEDEFKFYVLSKTKTLTEQITADKKEYVKQKATGKLTVYNLYSNKPLKIIKNTRFKAEDGKIYRAKNSFVIPGYKEKNGKKIPGKVVVEVYADEPGQEYDRDKGKFKLPGLKDTPLYDKVWAEVATPITGGFVGERPIVSEAAVQQALDKLKSQAQQELEKELLESYQDKLLLKDTLSYTFANTQEPANDAVIVKLVAKAQVAGFDQTEFAEKIAKQNEVELEEGKKVIVNKDDVIFTVKQTDDTLPENMEKIVFSAQGVLKVRWQLSEDKIKAALAGKKISEIDSIMAQFHGIKSYEVDAFPLMSRFPESLDRIEVVIEFE